jgi:SAM-dependent methyltransferase
VNKFFPCHLVEHENYNSIVSSSFHIFDDYFGDSGGGGYTVEKLAKKLVKENGIKNIKFDSEAGMFCAYSTETERLLELCKLLQQIVGDEGEHIAADHTQPLIALDIAEELLIKGFVQGTDIECQKKFLESVPFPALTKKQTEYLQSIEDGTEDEIIYSLKRINSEARTKTREWNHYLSHPKTITIFLEKIDKENSPKVYQELIWALRFISDRHLPDLRTLPYFLESLDSKIAQNRLLGIAGLQTLYDFPMEAVLKLHNDKSEKVRGKIKDIKRIAEYHKTFPIWMFDKEYDKKWWTRAVELPLQRTKTVSQLTNLLCPICGKKISTAGKSALCPDGHNFDFARQGYLNLNISSSKSKYTTDLYSARHRLYKKGVFDPLVSAICSMLLNSENINFSAIRNSDCPPAAILDAGCGDGSLLAAVMQQISLCGIHLSGLGIDLSKDAVKTASRTYPSITWCAADLARPPVADNTQDIILNILAPANYAEFKRLLTFGGLLIKVLPGPSHFNEIRLALEDSSNSDISGSEASPDTLSPDTLSAHTLSPNTLPAPRETPSFASELSTIEVSPPAMSHALSHFTIIETQRLTWDVPAKDNIEDFIKMSPLSWHIPDQKKTTAKGVIDSIRLDYIITLAQPTV